MQLLLIIFIYKRIQTFYFFRFKFSPIFFFFLYYIVSIYYNFHIIIIIFIGNVCEVELKMNYYYKSISNMYKFIYTHKWTKQQSNRKWIESAWGFPLLYIYLYTFFGWFRFFFRFKKGERKEKNDADNKRCYNNKIVYAFYSYSLFFFYYYDFVGRSRSLNSIIITITR